MPLPKVAVVVCDRFVPFHLSVPCIVFGDFLPGHELFELRICAFERGPLRSSVGLTVARPLGLEYVSNADVVIVPSWRNPAERPSEDLLRSLVTAHQRGAKIVGLCLGGYVLAYAGLLNGRQACVHWEFAPDFARRFPGVRLDSNLLHLEDDGIITSAGTGAGFDCCLHVVRYFYGHAIVDRLARRLLIPSLREAPVEASRPECRDSAYDSTIDALLHFLRANLRDTHHLDELARKVAMSRRTFTRRFQRATGMSVGDWVLIERLEESKILLTTTRSSIETVADRIGISSSAFRQHFRTRFGTTPTGWRKSRQREIFQRGRAGSQQHSAATL